MSLEDVKQSKVNKACKNCGAELRYQPGTDFLKCDYCGYREEFGGNDTKSVLELDLQKYLSKAGSQTHSETITMIHCNGCGADQHIGEHLKTKNCVFCGSILEMKDLSKSHWISPGAIIPFFIDRHQANEYFIKWINGLWFAPNKFKKATLNTDHLNGVYLPFWTFDAEMEIRYTGERGVYYYENKRVSVQVNGKTEYRNKQIRKTRWLPVQGLVNGFIDDTLILASEKRKVYIDEKVSNWDLSKMKSYNSKYLAGYITEKYTIPLQKGHLKAEAQADQIAIRWAKQDIGGDSQRVHQCHKQLSNETFKHILLPLYLSNYHYAGKEYAFQINGQTGALSGKRPYSLWKICLTILFGLSLVFGLLYFLNQNEV